MEASRLPLAVRAWTDPGGQRRRAPRGDALAANPRVILVIDTETTVDASQRLNFGSYRVFARPDFTDELEGVPDWQDYLFAEEGLLHADDLEARDPAGLQVLREYCRVHPGLGLQSRDTFVDEVFLPLAHDAQALVVGFNLPFDLSRLAEAVSPSRRRRRGFSFTLSSYQREGQRRENRYDQRLIVAAIDSKRAFIELGSARDTLAVDMVPDEDSDGERRFHYRGRFLDLRTLAFALTDRSHSLSSACDAFEVEHGKQVAEEHGAITAAYIDYNRADVRATWELYCRLREEYERHPIGLPPTAAWSPASIGKAYLEAMDIKPVLERQPDFAPEVLGHAMTAYFGGRAECRIRRAAVPVAYVDFLSMYPTVNTLMGNWRLLTAREISVEPAVDSVRAFLERVTLDDLFEPETWPKLAGLVLVQPDGDVLPARAKYDGTGEWQIGVNPLTSSRPLWFTLADVVAAKLLSPDGKVPTILDAVRLVPSRAAQRGLKAVSLRGSQLVEPTDDFFRRVIELRRGTEIRGLPEAERRRLSDFLKVLANSASYGVFAEMNERDDAKAGTVVRHGLDSRSVEVASPEEPGRWSFPPLAAFIAGGARLMLALLERSISDLGGTYAFCDTDSMGIVATQRGGRLRGVPGTAGVRALSWAEVDGIIQRFELLKPYDPDEVTATLLKLEDENFAADGSQRQLHCYAISAKRYCLYSLERGRPVIRKFLESGLGQLLDPLDPEHEPVVPDPDANSAEAPATGRPWIRQFWEDTVDLASGTEPPDRPWMARPALSQLTVSTPALLRDFEETNRDRSYDEQVKPFNFMLIANDASIGPDRKVLVAPYERDPARWLRLPWRNRSDGTTHSISVRSSAGGSRAVRVGTYATQFELHRVHLEAKSLGTEGAPVRALTAGLLLRRPVVAVSVEHIGKEAKNLDQVAAGLVGAEGAYAVFEDAWPLARKVLADASVSIQRAMAFTGRRRSATMALRAGTSDSSHAHRAEMVMAVAAWCRAELGVPGLSDLEALDGWLAAHVV